MKVVSEISLLVVPENGERFSVEAGVPFEHPDADFSLDETHPYLAKVGTARAKTITGRTGGSPDEATVTPVTPEAPAATPEVA